MKSRTLAQALIETGYIRDRRQARSKSRASRCDVGSVIALAACAAKSASSAYSALPRRRGPAREARACYEEVEPEPGN